MEIMSCIVQLVIWCVMIGMVMCATSDFTVRSSSDCKSVTVDTSGTEIKWSGASLTNCKIHITKEDLFDDDICVKMEDIDLQDFNNKVEFRTSVFSSVQKWDRFSSSSIIPDCTYSISPYIEINTDYSPGESFKLKVYTKKDAGSSVVTELANTAVVTVGVIVGIIVGLIVLIIIIVIVVCCCCMRGRRSQGHVYRQPQTATTVVTHQHQMVPQTQPQGVYPQPQPLAGYPAQQPPVTGYPAQPMAGYNAPPPPAPAPVHDQYQGSGVAYPPAQYTGPTAPSAPSAPPPENMGYMEKPPPYS